MRWHYTANWFICCGEKILLLLLVYFFFLLFLTRPRGMPSHNTLKYIVTAVFLLYNVARVIIIRYALRVIFLYFIAKFALMRRTFCADDFLFDKSLLFYFFFFYPFVQSFLSVSRG